MSLETGTYISDLDASNPPGADPRSQGDDHLRLVKSVAKATFPNASKAFRFPTTAAEASGTVNVTFPTDQNKLFPVSASGAARVVNLPDPTSGATVNEDAFAVSVVKTDSTSNAVTVTASGAQTINGASTLVLSKQWDMVLLVWAGTDDEWYAIFTPAEASETVKGLVERATDAEAAAGTDTTRYISAAQLHEARADVASGATVDLGAVASNFARITGTTTITSFGTAADGVWRDVTFSGALTLTHHATNLILPGAANITTAANDRLRARSLGAGAWIVLQYTKAAGTAIIETQSSGVNIPAREYDTYVASEDITGAGNTIPQDDSIPQLGEGFEILSQAITLKRATSRLQVIVEGFGGCRSSQNDDARTWTVALFKDGAADAVRAVRAGYDVTNATSATLPNGNFSMVYEELPGAVGPFTFSVEVGVVTATDVLRLNGTANGRLYGGVAVTSITLKEIFV